MPYDQRQAIMNLLSQLQPGMSVGEDLSEEDLRNLLLDARDRKRGGKASRTAITTPSPSPSKGKGATPRKLPKGGNIEALLERLAGGAKGTPPAGVPPVPPSLLGGAAWPLALMFLVPQLLSSGMDIWKTGKEIDLAKRGQANESMANAMLVQRQANRDAQSRADAMAARKEEMSLMQSMASREQQEAASNRIMGLLMGGQGDRMNLSRGPGSSSDEDIRRLAAMGKLSVWDKLGIQ